MNFYRPLNEFRVVPVGSREIRSVKLRVDLGGTTNENGDSTGCIVPYRLDYFLDI